jgi:hypothetical protein
MVRYCAVRTWLLFVLAAPISTRGGCRFRDLLAAAPLPYQADPGTTRPPPTRPRGSTQAAENPRAARGAAALPRCEIAAQHCRQIRHATASRPRNMYVCS